MEPTSVLPTGPLNPGAGTEVCPDRMRTQAAKVTLLDPPAETTLW